MLKNHEPGSNIEDLSDVEIYATIDYLDPDPLDGKKQNDGSGVTSAIVLILWLLGLGFIWLYL